MSLRQWNSVSERARLERYILMSEKLLQADALNDSCSSDSSMEGMVISLDQDLSFLTDIEDDEEDDDEEDAMSIDMIRAAAHETIAYSNYIYCPLLDKTIDFAAPSFKIIDLDEFRCILNFCFRKLELLEIADLLWPKMELFLQGTRNKILVQNRYTCDYETGLLLVLFRLSHPRRLHPDMEAYFKMRKSRISVTITTFIDALYCVALPYLSDPSIFQDQFELHSRLIQ